MIVAEKIAQFLAERGCTHMFGLVGGANSVLLGALTKRMEFVCVAHEQAAAMAATYYYRVCGRIAPVVVTAGAGCMNTLTGVMAAHMDGIPLLVISGNEKSMYFKAPQSRVMGFQGFIPSRVVGTFTKRAASADGPVDALALLRDLYGAALSPRQGACWYDIPQDIAAMEVS